MIGAAVDFCGAVVGDDLTEGFDVTAFASAFVGRKGELVNERDSVGLAVGEGVFMGPFFEVGDRVGAFVVVGASVDFLVGAVVCGLAMLPRLIKSFLKRLKSMDPMPVVGSQPGVAWKPCGQQVAIAPTPQLFFPARTSLLNIFCLAYSVGFNQPIDGFLAASRAAFTKETIPAKTGEDADVPDTANQNPPTAVK